MRQADLFDTPADTLSKQEPVLFRADPDKVRHELTAILEQAKNSSRLPWSQEALRYHQTVFPQMSRWLPEDEAEQLCFEFAQEIERLLAA